MTKIKSVEWMDRPRANRLASVMWPGLADEDAKRDMTNLSRQEGKVSPLERPGGKSEWTKRSKSSW